MCGSDVGTPYPEHPVTTATYAIAVRWLKFGCCALYYEKEGDDGG